MARLRVALAAALLVAAPAKSHPADRWARHIADASVRFGVPEAWIRRVMRAESGGRTTLHGSPIVSRAGAIGLMQLMPGTWRDMRALLGLGSDPQEPRDNIMAGTAYLRVMYDRFGYPGLFAAYNAGPARYAGHLATGRRLPAETVAYVAEVTGRGSADSRAKARFASSLFTTTGAPALMPGVAAGRGDVEPAPALFVRLTGAPR